MGAHGRDEDVRRFRRDDGDQLALVGDVKRIEAKEFAGRGNFRPDRDRCSSIRKPMPDCWAISLRAAARPPRVGSRMARSDAPRDADHLGDEAVQSGAVGQMFRFEAEVARFDMTATP